MLKISLILTNSNNCGIQVVLRLKMQVIQIIVLLIVFILTTSDCREIDTTSISTSQAETNHTKLPLFPRMNVKFVVDSRKISKKADVDQDITTKKPLMPKFVPKTNFEVNVSNRVTVTRKPLMKPKNFTVKIITNRRIPKFDDDNNSTKNNYEINANNNSVTKRHKTKKIQFFARTRDNGIPKVVASTTVNYFAEERKDRKEFIFLKSKNEEEVTDHDLLQMDDENLETTTAKVDVEENMRPKRSVNIIEEEIRVTTTPLRKYSDHDVKSNSDRFFNNVNT